MELEWNETHLHTHTNIQRNTHTFPHSSFALFTETNPYYGLGLRSFYWPRHMGAPSRNGGKPLTDLSVRGGPKTYKQMAGLAAVWEFIGR